MDVATPGPDDRADPDLEGQHFDTVVIGGGINGASAAQHLAAKGFSVLLLERNDFGSGASSRSSRIMHFGLRYLDRGEPVINYVTKPSWFLRQCVRARATMAHRAELARTVPSIMTPFEMFVPLYEADHVAPWQMSLAFSLINAIGVGTAPVEWRRVASGDWPDTAFAKVARDHDQLKGLFAYTEHQFDWPERLVADYVMDARRMGAVCCNYAEVVGFSRANRGWELSLRHQRSQRVARVVAKQIVNTAGPWIDRVLRSGAANDVVKQVAATKGAHMVVRLDDAFRAQGFAHFNRKGYPFYCLPWRELHLIGPTETAFEGDPEDVRTNDEDIATLLDDANYMLPGLKLTRDDIISHWSGVRPMPFIPGYKGKQNLIPQFHDHASEGLPNVLSVPGGPLMVHRKTGRRIAAEVAKRIAPSGQQQQVNYATRVFPDNTNSPPVNPTFPRIRLSHLPEIARDEQVTSLSDLLLRRTGLGWTEDANVEDARRAAEAVAGVMGWSDIDIDREVEAYRDDVRRNRLDVESAESISQASVADVQAG